MTKAERKARDLYLLMTWEEIEPIAERFLGKNCGEMTLREFAAEAQRRRYKSASEFMRLIEKVAEEVLAGPEKIEKEILRIEGGARMRLEEERKKHPLW